jgi:uncharacterized Rossmann fold enzyme
MISQWLFPPKLHFLRRILRGQEPRAHYMRFLRELVAWTVPAEVQSAVLSGAYTLLGNDVRDNITLRDRHLGARCFVFGNGPSLKDADLTLLRNEITVGANSFYKHPQAAEVDLKYLCIGDASFMEDSSKCVAWHRIIAEQHPRAVLMLNPSARQLIKKHRLYSQHEVHFYRAGIATDNPDLVHHDFLKPLNVGHNTGSRLAIPLAMYMGCREMTLLGFDANWMENYRGSYHFYKTHELFPEFDSQEADKRWPRYADQLINALRDFEGHATLAEYAKDHAFKILNGSPASLLDMYPRVNYVEYLQQRSAANAVTAG